jgi:hypothetical protein
VQTISSSGHRGEVTALRCLGLAAICGPNPIVQQRTVSQATLILR